MRPPPIPCWGSSTLWMGFATTLPATLAAMAAAGLAGGVYSSNIHAALFDVIAPRYRASAVAMMTTVAFLIGSTSPWLLGYCCAWCADGNGLSYGFAGLSAAYLAGSLAIVVALKHTFEQDSIAETPLRPNPLSEDA
jgi:MFS transporter, Spinster family, sphingosine-1-phosphate transporter